MSEANGRAEALRLAGFGDAVDLLAKLDAINAKADEIDQPQPPPEPQRQHDAQAEGEALMAALRRDVPSLFEDR